MNPNTNSHTRDAKHNDDAGHDPIYGPFPAAVRWSALDLAAAVHLPEPLHNMTFTPSANDALLHRPRQGTSFLPAPTRTNHFKVGG